MVANLSNSNGIGIERFSIRSIKSVIEFFAKPLASIFNKSFQTGVFPDRLQYAKITPVHKGDDKRLINNCHPISIPPVFSKVLEKLMHLRLTSFFIDTCNLICDNQYGFRAKHTAYMALLNIMDQISIEIDNRKYFIGIFLDLSEAFDTIDHNIFLKKLEIYGIR